jgi:hypothetical protein
MPSAPRKPWIANTLWTGALGVLFGPILYVLSYPVTVRVTGTHQLSGYKPVEWLIDDTSLREPLLAWADVCGAGLLVRNGSVVRLIDSSF